MKRFVAGFFLIATAAMAQDPFMDGHAPGELFFRKAGVAVRLHGADSILVTIGARSEDLQNTVGVFPYYDELTKHKDTATFRLFESKLEAYLQQRVPVRVDGKNVYLRVVQWKPKGKGREDRLDMPSLYVEDLFITLGGRLPKKRDHLDVTMNMWVERRDAAETEVQFSFFDGKQPLRRLWSKREVRIRFPLHPDSLSAMRADPPPKLLVPVEDEHDDHSGHSH